jgi:hypothetical protein
MSEQLLKVDHLGGSHGLEGLGIMVHEHVEEANIDGLRSHIAYPDAVEQGVRYVVDAGTEDDGHDILESYPGNPEGSSPERAAHATMLWLGPHAGDPNVAVYDTHNTDILGMTAAFVAGRASKAAMVGAWTLGYNKFCLFDSKFQQEVPNAIQLENGISPAEFPDEAQRLYRGLGRLARTTVAELAGRYEEMVADPNVGFYTAQYICTTTTPGGDTLQPFIEELEAVHSNGPFTQLNLSTDLLAAIGISKYAGRVLAETWGHDNMSNLAPHLGVTADGTPRRAWFGAVFLPAPALVTVPGNEAWVQWAA